LKILVVSRDHEPSRVLGDVGRHIFSALSRTAGLSLLKIWVGRVSVFG
jgi:hypothetical protein